MPDDLAQAFQETAGGLGRLYTSLDDASLRECFGLIDDMPRLRESLKIVSEKVENRAGELMADRRVSVDGVTWEKSRPPARKAWDSEALLSAVLDSRIVDDNGEVVEETPLERVRHVWLLPGYAARLTALKERRIDPDLFSEVSWDDRPWRVARLEKKQRRKR